MLGEGGPGRLKGRNEERGVLAIPDYQTLMLPVLRLACENERRVVDVVEQIADEFELTAEERDSLLPSGRQRMLHNRIHWAKFYMTKAVLLASPGSGRFFETDAGRALDRKSTRLNSSH